MRTLLLLLLSLAVSTEAFAFAPAAPGSALERPPLRPLSAKTATADGRGDSDACTIQILMSDTGGGHRASANALRDAFDVLHPGRIHCDIVDIFTDYGPFWPFNDYPRMYKIMAEYSFLWDWFYHLGSTPLGLALNEFVMDVCCLDAFAECLARPQAATNRRADMVVSVHPLCQDVPLKCLSLLDSNGATKDREGRTETPFCTVVTDLGGAHPTWFNKDVDKCFVPSDALYRCAQDRNVQPSQLIQYGLPIRKGFWSTTGRKSKLALRDELNLDADLPTVLLVGGGDGMGGIVEIAKSVGATLGSNAGTPQYQMVVVCGNNQKAKEALSAPGTFGPGVKVQVQGFVNNMDEWMQASDALVTKAGPGTIAEASICGLPCMLFSFLPGQEEGNVPFVENAGFGTYSADPTVIAETVSQWLASPEKLKALQDAALEAARPAATLDIAKDLADIALKAHAKHQQTRGIVGVSSSASMR